jgi:ATP/ADP translocase
MAGRQKRFLNVKRGEWALALSLLLLLLVNTLVLELADVVATAGFISSVGPRQILWLWIVDMVITLVSASLYATIVDRVQRVWLVGALFLVFALLYLILRLLFSYGAPGWLTYPLLYIMSDQQYAIFPLAFWALSSDIYSMAESKRLFPIIAAGAALGNVLGNGLAAASATAFENQSGTTVELLTLSAALFLAGFIFIWLVFRNREIRARQSQETEFDVRETLKVGIDFIKNVPMFTYLAIFMLLVGLSFTIIEYHFLFTIDQVFTSDPLRFQTFYGIYKAVLVVSTLLIQWLVTGKFMERVGIKSTFVVVPSSLIVAAGGALALPGLIGGVGGRFLARLVQRAWDEPARKSLQGMIPDERRGRVSAFLDSYFYSFATIVGCLVLGGLLLASSVGWLEQAVGIIIYLVVAGLAGAGALWAALRIRQVYDKSLLNWRLSRPRRKSILDDIEF